LVTVDFGKENRFHEGGLSGELSCKECTASCWDELARSSMYGVSMEGCVNEIKSNCAERFARKDAFGTSLFDSIDEVVFDGVEVGYCMRAIDEAIGAFEPPDFSNVSAIPSVIFL